MEHSTKNQFFLKKGEVLELKANTVITVGSGLVWITVAGDYNDYLLRSGEQIKLEGAKPVIEAVQSSYVIVEEKPSKYKLFNLLLEWNGDVLS